MELLPNDLRLRSYSSSQATLANAGATSQNHLRMVSRRPQKIANGILAPQTTCEGFLVSCICQWRFGSPKPFVGGFSPLRNDLPMISQAAQPICEWLLGQNFQKDKCSQNIHTPSTSFPTRQHLQVYFKPHPRTWPGRCHQICRRMLRSCLHSHTSCGYIGCRVLGLGCRALGLGCRVLGLGCRVLGLGCRV